MRIIRRQVIGLLVAALFAPSLAYARKAASTSTRVGPAPPAGLRSSTVQASAKHNGHMSRHVSRSNDYLRARVDSGRARLTFNAVSSGATMAKMNAPVSSGRTEVTRPPASRRQREAIARLKKFDAKPRRTSTFHDARVADAMYARALRDNRSKIARWLKDPNSSPSLVVPFSSKSPIGTVYTGRKGGQGRFRAANDGVFVLSRIGQGGFYPMTAKLH